MASDLLTVPIKRETKTLLDALALFRRAPAEDIVHEAILRMFAGVAEPMNLSSQTEIPPPAHKGKTQLTSDGPSFGDKSRDLVLGLRTEPARSIPPSPSAHIPTPVPQYPLQTSGRGPSLADRIRDFVLRNYIGPARKSGELWVEITVKDVHNRMGLEQRHPAVISALQARVFLETANVKLASTRGPYQSSTKVLRFEFLPDDVTCQS